MKKIQSKNSTLVWNGLWNHFNFILLFLYSGTVFNVTSGKTHYGEGKGYSIFAGRDASRAFITGCFKSEDHLTHDVRDFNEKQLNALYKWYLFYVNHHTYNQVGIVNLPFIEPSKPIPESCAEKKKEEALSSATPNSAAAALSNNESI